MVSDGTRQRTRAFSGLQSHYLFEDRYGRPGKGNDKGNVEGVVGYARRNFMTPLPRFASWDAFNGHLEEQCRNRQGNVLRGHRESIGERFVCSAPGSLDTSLSHAAGLIEIAACHA